MKRPYNDVLGILGGEKELYAGNGQPTCQTCRLPGCSRVPGSHGRTGMRSRHPRARCRNRGASRACHCAVTDTPRGWWSPDCSHRPGRHCATEGSCLCTNTCWTHKATTDLLGSEYFQVLLLFLNLFLFLFFLSQVQHTNLGVCFVRFRSNSDELKTETQSCQDVSEFCDIKSILTISCKCILLQQQKQTLQQQKQTKIGLFITKNAFPLCIKQ